MRAKFWHDRWEQNQIGFHQESINPYLQHYWPALKLATDCTVFVPLCGKSYDMLWLREQGHQVLGIELSARAVQDFFTEQAMEPTRTQQGAFERWEADGIALLVGDFFQLSAADLAGCSGIYDRAALIAMPADMRLSYAAHFSAIVPVHSQTLLVSLEYDQSLAGGPPFSVAPAEVQEHYSPHFHVAALASVDVSNEASGLRNKGVPKIEEHVFHLTKL